MSTPDSPTGSSRLSFVNLRAHNNCTCYERYRPAMCTVLYSRNKGNECEYHGERPSRNMADNHRPRSASRFRRPNHGVRCNSLRHRLAAAVGEVGLEQAHLPNRVVEAPAVTRVVLGAQPGIGLEGRTIVCLSGARLTPRTRFQQPGTPGHALWRPEGSAKPSDMLIRPRRGMPFPKVAYAQRL